MGGVSHNYCLLVLFRMIQNWESFGPDYRVIPPSIPELESSVPIYAGVKGLHKNLSDAPLSGKAVIIDKDKLTLHPLMRKLPSSVRAEKPSDVKVVIWVETERVHAFDLVLVPESSRYTTTTAYPAHNLPPPGAPSIPAYQANWKVTVIDLESREIRRVGTFNGPDPPVRG